MKNFKRVISAVIALAISASTLVAVSASKFPDVDDTNSYAGAINLLAALDVVSGYPEDGTFRPDGDITRAEAARMIVSGLNMNADATAAAGTSKFTDVNEKASWASGFVNVGVAQGYINGMDATTFAPQENVTYAQLCVMLTTIAGYKEYAEAYGGWPTGYTTIAASTGINKGVSLAADAKLKRGQVAQMLYNAMVTPMLGVKKYSLQGNEYAVQDGDDLAFKTVLSSKFDGYEVKVTVQGTPKSGEDKGKARIDFKEKAYIDEVKGATATSGYEKKTNLEVFDDFGLDNYLYMSGKATLIQDASDKWHLVYFEADDNETVTVSAGEFLKQSKGGKDIDSDHKITFGSKDYSLNTTPASLELYVNGTLYLTGATFTKANVEAILAKAQGKVSLIDADDTVKGYEKIMVTVYDIAKVTAVDYSNKITTISVSPKIGIDKKDGSKLATGISDIKVKDSEIEDDSIDLSVKNKDGEAVELSSIKKDDIIAFAIDPEKTAATVDNLKALEIIVTDETFSGVCTKLDNAKGIVGVDNQDYEITVNSVMSGLGVNTTYKVYLDPFGRIYETEVEGTAAKFAIAEKYDEDLGVQLILPNGSAQYYEVEANAVGDPSDLINNGAAPSASKTIDFTKFNDYLKNDWTIAGGKSQEGRKSNPEERVVSYKLKSNGKISEITLVGKPNNTSLVYSSRTEKLAGKSILDTTVIINAEKYNGNVADYSAFGAGSFVDKTVYEGEIWSVASGTASFIVLTKVGDTITGDTRFAVARDGAVESLTEDGTECYSVSVLYEGKEQDLLFAKKPTSLKAGTAFYFVTDNDGLVSAYAEILSVSKIASPAAGAPTFGRTFNYVYKNLATLDGNNDGEFVISGETFSFDKTKWDYTLVKTNAAAKYQLVFGVITDVTNKGVEMIEIPAGSTFNLNNDTEFFGLDSDCVKYRYAINETDDALEQKKSINVSDPRASVIDNYKLTTGDGADYDLSTVGGAGAGKLAYAVALIADGDIVEIYTITQ